jgi:threonine-phosphate decarboxylase
MKRGFPGKAVHGGTAKKILESTGVPVLDFSACLNPCPPEVTWSPDPTSLACYPDDSYARLKEAISRTFGRPVDEICVGNGSIELIRVFCSVVLQKGNRFYIEEPTFSEYALSARLFGAQQSADLCSSKLAFFCNPNNPTGTLRSRSEMSALLAQVKEHDATLFADEVFIDLADPEQSLVSVRDEHLFILRSLTKNFSVPGIRFGYGFGDPDLVECIETMRPPWSVNAFAEAFAVAAFAHYDRLAASREYIKRERGWLERKLMQLELRYEPSSVNYLLIDTGRNASEICAAFLRRGILVRDCTSFGLPTSIRIAVRTHDENVQLMEAFTACVL